MQTDEFESRAMVKLQHNPRKVLDAARRGTKRELVELANLWLNMGPELLEMDLLSVFFAHLKPTLIPTVNPNNIASGLYNTPAADRAWVCLVALTKLGNIIAPLHPQVNLAKIETQVMQGWEGIYKWCLFMFTTRVAQNGADGTGNISPDIRRSTMDVLGGVLYSLSRSEKVRQVMVETEGSLELATRLWIVEDTGPVPTSLPIPTATAALDALLTIADWNPQFPEDENDEDPQKQEETVKLEVIGIARGKRVRAMLDRVVAAAGGSATNIVGLAVSRLRTATSNNAKMHEPRTALTLDLIGHLARTPDHALRLGFLSAGMTAFMAKLAVKIGGLLEGNARPQIGLGFMNPMPNGQSQAEGLQDALIASLGFLSNTLESTDGFSWVVKAIHAGLLQAWVSAARDMHRFSSREDAEMVLELLSTLVSRYLVYKSVVTAVDGAMKKLQDDPNEVWKDWKDPQAKAVWKNFIKLALERYRVGIELKEVKKYAATCDNVKCQKVDAKNTFMKCSSCSNTLYCSRECQTVAWKEGGHKIVCKLKQQELLEGKYQSISKGDSEYFHHLSTYDARHNRPYLRSFAASKYPELASNPAALVISIDYLKVPPKFSMHPLAEHDKYAHNISPEASANAEARNDELIQRARDHPGKFAIIQSKIANGQSMQSVNSMVTGVFWEKEGWAEDADLNVEPELTLEKAVDVEGPKKKPAAGKSKIKDVTEAELQMGRMALNDFLRSMGEPPAF
ncbi:hypothetical protein GALMADRAFT_263522 [Galerina marginata CBS 339.88]|uniref:MYND-type domain-containing protein n=1 Tax=Galerina marginata (strain CBS 339.88) TaxID=685588 RepID=A0A067TT77_GALM3|nr:hypothetical protein GALMADRAFT_263522 [Galerina marginata CBS 339.88]